MEGSQSGLSISGSYRVWSGRDTRAPSGTDSGSLSAARGVFADRRHHRAGLFESSAHRAIGFHWQRSGPRTIAAQHPGGASGAVAIGSSTRGSSGGVAGAKELDSHSAAAATPKPAPPHVAPARIRPVDPGSGPTRFHRLGQQLDVDV